MVICVSVHAITSNLQHVYLESYRVYQPGFSYSEVVKCTIDTTAETIMGKYVHNPQYNI